MFFKRIALASAAALTLGLFVQSPASAVPQPDAFVFVTPRLVTPGGTIDCSSGCTTTQLPDGSTEIDLGNGESILVLPDGTNVGAP